MRRQYLRLSALAVTILMVTSLGATPVLANEDDARPVDIRYDGSKVKHRTIFEISFIGFSRFFRLANRHINESLNLVSPPVYEPIEADYDGPIFLMSHPRHKEDPEELPRPNGIIDDGNPY